MTHFSGTRLLTLLLTAALLALPLQISAQAGDSSPNDGYVSEGIYVNKFFGFTYKLPQNLVPQSNPPFKEHPNDPSGHSTTTFALLLAATPVKPYKNVAISVQSAADLKDGAAYLRKVAASAIKNGLSVLSDPERKTFADKSFFRQDYSAPQGTFFQTHACTVYKGYVLDFVFSATERGDIEKLFNSLNTLKFVEPDKSVQ